MKIGDKVILEGDFDSDDIEVEIIDVDFIDDENLFEIKFDGDKWWVSECVLKSK